MTVPRLDGELHGRHDTSMARLHYFMVTSLNGCVTDASGRFGWAEPDDDVRCELDLVETHRFGNGTAYLHYRKRG